MQSAHVLLEIFERIRSSVHAVVEDLDTEALTWQPDPEANTIGWLTWHLARVQDDHIADVAGREQVWDHGNWSERFSLPPGAPDMGFGHSPEQVAGVRPDGPAAIIEYLDTVTDQTRAYLEGLSDSDLDAVIDESWDPPVTLGVRLVSVIGDGLKHVGQAEYVKGLYERRDD